MRAASPFVLFGLLWIVLGLPLWLRLVPPNPLYGVRLPVTASSKDAWYAVNTYAGSRFVVCGLALSALGAAFLLWSPPWWLEPAAPGVPLLALAVPLFGTLRYAGRYKRDRAGTSPRPTGY